MFKVISLPRPLSKLKEARGHLVMMCTDADSSQPWLVGLLNIHRGTLIKEPLNLEPLMRKRPEKVTSGHQKTKNHLLIFQLRFSLEVSYLQKLDLAFGS